jgi:multidrug efflux pump subunit AcrA (membrane-fusion protein)
MTTLLFLAEWAIRSSILILTGTLLLWALRIKDPSIRLAAWITMLCASLAIPALAPVLPKVPITIERAATHPVESPIVISETAPVFTEAAPMNVRAPFDWARAAVISWALVTLALLLRLCIGFAMSLRLLRSSRATEQIEIRESDLITAPVTLGIMRPAIVLPADWPQWRPAKLDAVLAHERSHIRRHDPAVQLFSAIHRALLWHSPLSWFLHKQIVRTAEETSDDAAIRETHDRVLYAEVLLDFMQRGTANPTWLGVPMARYAKPDQRINRILDGTTLSRGITRWTVAAILALASPFAYVIAAAHPKSAPLTETLSLMRSETETLSPGQTSLGSAPVVKGAATDAPLSLPTPVSPQPPQLSLNPRQTPQSRERAVLQRIKEYDLRNAQPASAHAYLNALGNVTALNTVTIRSRIEGELISVNFKEGESVQAGQILARIDDTSLQLPLAQAEVQLAEDRQLPSGNTRAGKLRIDQAMVDNAKLQLSYAQIKSPIAGVAGLRIVGPGNIVGPSDHVGIVIITQLQPIAVLFSIPEDTLRQVREHLKNDASVPVEAWDRTGAVKMATGRLTAVDNQIDQTTGTIKLKAEFDNKDDALFPNQFVNVHLILKP